MPRIFWIILSRAGIGRKKRQAGLSIVLGSCKSSANRGSLRHGKPKRTWQKTAEYEAGFGV